MKMLLSYPEFPDTFWSFKDALNFILKTVVLPSLGLRTVTRCCGKSGEGSSRWDGAETGLEESKAEQENQILIEDIR